MIEHSAYLAIDAGGTYLKSAVLNKEGSVLEGSFLMVGACSKGSKEEILHAFKEIIFHGLSFIGNRKMLLTGIGIAFPGPFDCRNGISLMKHKFLNIYGVNLRECFYKIPGILPNIPIRFISDANAVLASEMWKGNARGFVNAAVIILGTGLGFSFSVGNVVQCNNLGGPAIAIYKIPYKEGILEDFIAKRGVLKVYSEISGDAKIENIEVADIGKWADEGNENCIRTFCEVGRILAVNLEKILQENSIQCLLFGGQISRSFCHMENALKQGLKNVESLRIISKVKNIDNAPLLGACEILIHTVNELGVTIQM